MGNDSYDQGRAGAPYESWMDRYQWEKGQVDAEIYGTRPVPYPSFEVDSTPGSPSHPPAPPRATAIDLSPVGAFVGGLIAWLFAYTLSLWKWCALFIVIGAGMSIGWLTVGADPLDLEHGTEGDSEMVATYLVAGAIYGWVIGTLFRIARGSVRTVRNRFRRDLRSNLIDVTRNIE